MELYNTLGEGDLLRVQVMQDLLCCAKAHDGNATKLLALPKFHHWLLTSLAAVMPSEGGETDITWEIGCRLHTTLLLCVIPTWGNSRLEDSVHWAQGRTRSLLLVKHLLSSVFNGLTEMTKKY
jgi:hypothetical protein